MNRSQKKRTLHASGLAHFIHDGLTDCLYVFLPLWAEIFGLTHTQVGVIKMCSSGALAFFQIPAGFLAEKFSEKSVLSVGTAVAGLGLMLTSIASSYVSLLMAILILGAGAATQHPLASTLVSRAYRQTGARAALGIYNFSGDLGKVAVPVGVAATVHYWGWQQGALGYGLIVVLSAPLLMFSFANLLKNANPAVKQSKGNWQGWGIVDRPGFSVLALISMIDTACRSAFLTFMPFLLINKDITGAKIGLALGLVFAGGATGKLVCGLIAEKVGIIKTVVTTEALTGILIITVIYASSPWIWIVLPVLGLALNGTSSVLYGTIGDFVDADRLPRAYGLFYTLAIGAGALAPIFYGFVSDAVNLEGALTLVGLSAFLIFPLCGVLNSALKRVEVGS